MGQTPCGGQSLQAGTVPERGLSQKRLLGPIRCRGVGPSRQGLSPNGDCPNSGYWDSPPAGVSPAFARPLRS